MADASARHCGVGSQAALMQVKAVMT